jgi:hypothetical protein
MSQSTKIKQMLDTGDWICATDILEQIRFIIDYRKRISEIKQVLPKNLELQSVVCHGGCGRKHTAGMHKYRIVEKGRLF